MKRLGCLLLVLILMLPGAAALAVPETWETMSDGAYSVRYPDTMRSFSALKEEYGWDIDVALDVEQENATVALLVIYAAPKDWQRWLVNGDYPDDRGERETMKRLPVDEPPVELKVDAEVHYALYRSGDGERMKEAFIVDPEGSELDFVLVCLYPANDEGGFRDTLHRMVETFSFTSAPGGSTRPTAEGGSFHVVSSYEYDGQHQVVKDLVVNRKSTNIYWIFADLPVTRFRVEKLTWNEKTFRVRKAKQLYSRKKLDPSEVIAVFDWLPEVFPTIRFRAVNVDGIEEIWYVSTDEENGKIVLLSEQQMADFGR